jgi:prophage antirepressor-like protein
MTNLTNKAQVFKSNSFGSLTVFIQGGQPWFIAKEVADTLGYSQTQAMTKRLRDKDKDNIPEFMIFHEVKKLAQTISSTENDRISEDKALSDSMRGMTRSWIKRQVN